MAKAIDLTGQKFGFLTVYERYAEEKAHVADGIEWLCICKCGRKAVRTTAELRRSLKIRSRPMCWDCLNNIRTRNKRRMFSIEEVVVYEAMLTFIITTDLEKVFGSLDHEEYFTNDQIDPYLER